MLSRPDLRAHHWYCNGVMWEQTLFWPKRGDVIVVRPHRSAHFTAPLNLLRLRVIGVQTFLFGLAGPRASDAAESTRLRLPFPLSSYAATGLPFVRHLSRSLETERSTPKCFCSLLAYPSKARRVLASPLPSGNYKMRTTCIWRPSGTGSGLIPEKSTESTVFSLTRLVNATGSGLGFLPLDLGMTLSSQMTKGTVWPSSRPFRLPTAARAVLLALREGHFVSRIHAQLAAAPVYAHACS